MASIKELAGKMNRNERLERVEDSLFDERYKIHEALEIIGSQVRFKINCDPSESYQNGSKDGDLSIIRRLYSERRFQLKERGLWDPIFDKAYVSAIKGENFWDIPDYWAVLRNRN